MKIANWDAPETREKAHIRIQKECTKIQAGAELFQAQAQLDYLILIVEILVILFCIRIISIWKLEQISSSESEFIGTYTVFHGIESSVVVYKYQ